jgi:hypothetical protein
VSDFEAEPDAAFSQEQWDKIARSVGLAELPEWMKQAISQAVFDYSLLSNEKREAARRSALKNTVESLTDLQHSLQRSRLQLSKLQHDLRPEKVIDQVEELISQAYHVQKTARDELENLPKSKGGRPRKLDRDALAEALIGIYAQFSGKPVSLSRSRDKQNKNRFIPGGPYYRFVSTILQESNVSTRASSTSSKEFATCQKEGPKNPLVDGMNTDPVTSAIRFLGMTVDDSEVLLCSCNPNLCSCGAPMLLATFGRTMASHARRPRWRSMPASGAAPSFVKPASSRSIPATT